VPIIEWQENFNTGIEEFDNHHKHLAELLNIAYDSFICGTASGGLGRLLDALIDYATYHFQAEEHWMEQNKYPNCAAHMDHHGRFTARILEIHADFVAGRKTLSLEILVFLKDWLTHHILVSDADYGRFEKTWLTAAERATSPTVPHFFPMDIPVVLS